MTKETKKITPRKTIGVVVSDEMDKTRVVLVSGFKKHPKYLRYYKTAKRFKAHDEKNECKVGDVVKVSDIFKVGDTVQVTGMSKGKGFAGAVKRWKFAGGPKTHGQSDRHRAPGAIGQGTTPGRVFKGKRMAGRMGFDKITVKNLKVIGIEPEKSEILISGPVPGTPSRVLMITKTNA